MSGLPINNHANMKLRCVADWLHCSPKVLADNVPEDEISDTHTYVVSEKRYRDWLLRNAKMTAGLNFTWTGIGGLVTSMGVASVWASVAFGTVTAATCLFSYRQAHHLDKVEESITAKLSGLHARVFTGPSPKQ